ncbi:hypothetical protein ACQI5H_24465 [Mycobacterium heidelbergense]|uniref:hypothetical protein n=1 Tax=Mycobacterium heidelbergense TaxID=53376 RepID=UPI003CFA6623
MDQHLAAMQRQLDQTTAQNRLLALRLRELAMGYRGIGAAPMGGMPASGLGNMMPAGRWRPGRVERTRRFSWFAAGLEPLGWITARTGRCAQR